MTKFVVNFSKYPAILDIAWTLLTEAGPDRSWSGCGVVHTYETDPDDFEEKMSDMIGRIEELIDSNMKNLQAPSPSNWHEADAAADAAVALAQFATAELHNFEQDFLLMAARARRGETSLCNLTL
jgi:hypothetical protein